MGCEVCVDGYSGRVGVFEVLTMTEELMDLFLREAPKEAIRKYLLHQHFVDLQESALLKVGEGLTTREEIKRCI